LGDHCRLAAIARGPTGQIKGFSGNGGSGGGTVMLRVKKISLFVYATT